ncbi:MAG: YfcE family phosphodiesterase [Fusobacteriaceae bacterium]
MKILVLSDSHGREDSIINLCEKEQPDTLIFLGDCTEDIEDLMYTYNNIKKIVVRGNCDFYDNKNKEETIVELENTVFFLTHGHLYNVKNTYEVLIKKSQEIKANIVLFGHTHIKELFVRDKIYYFNPGALKDNSYGIIIIENKNIKIEHKYISY